MVLIGTGASGIQRLPPLAESAKQVYVFQRTPRPSGAGEPPTQRIRRRTRARLATSPHGQLSGHHARAPVDEGDQIDDGWTHHYAVVNNPPRRKGMSLSRVHRDAPKPSTTSHGRDRRRVEQLVEDPDTAEILKPTTATSVSGPASTTSTSQPTTINVAFVDCPAGMECITEDGPVVTAESTSRRIVYGTGFEPERTPLIAGPAMTSSGVEA